MHATTMILAVLTASATAAPLNTRQSGLTCNSACPGVDFATMQQAQTDFCNAANGVTLTKGFSPNTYVWKSAIEMSWGMLDDPACPQTMTVNETTCVDNTNVPISMCNYGQDFGKQGGTWKTPCLVFGVTPNGC